MKSVQVGGVEDAEYAMRAPRDRNFTSGRWLSTYLGPMYPYEYGT